MTSDEKLVSFTEYRKKAQDATGKVACASCGKMIPEESRRCPICGIHFSGVAGNFDSEGYAATKRNGLPVIVIGVVAVVVVILFVFGNQR